MKKFLLMAVALLTFGAASAQSEVIAKYNEAAQAMQNKNFASAAQLFEQVIDKGMDSEDQKVLSCVTTAKKYLPVCYQRVGIAAASQKNYPKAIEELQKAADIAELYGNTTEKAKSNNILAKVYQVQGGEAFNAKDYKTAAEVFAKGYAANPRNTDMALNLAMSYCEVGEYQKGMDIYDNICALNAEKYAAAIAKAKEMKTLYTNNEVARLQTAGDNDAIVAMAEKMLATDPTSALAEKIRLQAYNGKKDYAKVIALGDTAAAAQSTEEDKSAVYYMIGAAYNAQYNAGGNKSAALREKAVSYLQKVTAGANVEAAKAALEGLK